MALLNWIFWKKTLFSTSVLGLTITPIILVNKYGSSNAGASDSQYKKNLAFLNGSYAKQFGINALTEDVFGIRKVIPLIEDVFAEDLAYLAVENTELFKHKFKDLDKEETEEFDKKYRSFTEETNKSIYKFYDDKGGSRSSMKRRSITAKAYDEFKKEILEFNEDNFTLNKYSETTPTVKLNTHISKEIIENKDNWKHIGFFSREESKHIHDKEFAKNKFNFINFAHKRWFQDVRPFFVWMSLWKHKEDASKHELESIWNSTKIKEKEGTLDKSSYSFPYFSSETNKKFISFYKDIVSQYDKDTNNTLYIPTGYTEDSASAIFVEGKNMYSNLYVRFAAAANYKYQKILSPSSGTEQFINSREKSFSVDSLKQPTELFMFEENSGEEIKARVKVSDELFNEDSYKSKKEIADLVEIKDTPWVFIRNRAGVHAIAVDSDNLNKETNKDVYGHFQFRTLQLLYKNTLNLTQTLDIKSETVINAFKEYLEKNFNSLLVQFAYSQDKQLFFNHSIPTDIWAFKASYLIHEQLEDLRNKYLSRNKLRESLINTYVQYKWDVDESGDTFKNANIAEGMVGMIPWSLNTENGIDENDSYVFDELEKIYDHNFFNTPQTSQETPKKLSEQYLKLEKEYSKERKKYLDDLKLRLDLVASDVKTDRVFTNNYYINRITDKFLEKTDVFNEFLFKYIMKTDYLGKSVIGNKGFVDLANNFEIVVPNELKPDGDNQDEKVIDHITDDNKVREIYGKIDSYIKSAYYSKILLENELTNPWEAAKYGGELLKQEKGKEKDHLRNVASQAFKNKFVFGISNFRSKHYRFLTTLAYLTANDFENLLEYLRSTMSYEKDTYIMFSHLNVNKEEKNNVKLSDESLHNPFLNRQGINTMTLKKEVDNVYKYFSAVSFSDSKNKVESDFFYQGFYTGNYQENLVIPHRYLENLVANGLYRYGTDKQTMNKYVLSISSNDEFKKVVEQIKKVVKTNSDWVQNLSLDHVYISSSGSSETKTIKTLTLQEKKNLLSAYLNDVKVEITSSAISKENYKKVFLTDPDASFNSTGSVHTPKTSSDGNSYEQKFQDSHFEKFSDVNNLEDSSKKSFKLFQINLENVKNFEAFKKYVNENLSRDIFWTWVINLAMKFNIQEKAVQNLSSVSEKIEVYDSKWSEKGEDKFMQK